MKRLLLLLPLLCSSCFAQVTLDQHATNSNSVVQTTGTCVLPSVSANALVLIAELLDDDGTTTFNTPTATGLTFAQIGSTVHAAGDFYFTLWRAYTASSLGSTTITGTWNTTSADWNFACSSYTGTAGTSANNGSDAIGSNNSATFTTGGTTPSVTVTSSSHNNSKYFGAVWYADSASRTITVGTGYSSVTAMVFNANFEGMATEVSTNPVSPAASTAVTGTISGGTAVHSGIFGVEILVSTGAPPASNNMPPVIY